MKFREIFRFEIASQSRRLSTWFYFLVLLGFTFRVATAGLVEGARSGGYFFNGPFMIASLVLLGSLPGLVVAAALAGDAAARDAQTRMHPLLYTTPIGRAGYLGGRFLGAYALNALILAAVPIGVLLATLVPGLEAELLGPFRPAGYLGAYLFLALPNAFVATALLFASAVLSRRAMASYVGGALLFIGSMFSWLYLAGQKGRWELAKLLDPIGLTVLSELSSAWTPIEKSTRLIGLEGSFLSNRLLWLGVASSALAITWLRFRFDHPVAGAWWSRRARREGRGSSVMVAAVGSESASSTPAWRAGGVPDARGAPITVPRVPRTFGAGTRAHQTLAFTRESIREIMTSWGGLVLAALAVILVLSGPGWMQHMGVPLLPTTESIVDFLGNSQDLIWVVVPLLTVFYAGELAWREREAGLSEIADAAPLPEWVPLLGRFVGLGLMLFALQALLMAASTLLQALLGYHVFEIGLYVRVLFGLQLVDYLLFALLALVVHVIVDQKYIGHMIALGAFAFMAFASTFGIEHNLLVYGSDPGWTYSDMRGFGPFLSPFIWFKLYWAAWALLLALAAKLLWVRGTEQGLRPRLRLARLRFTPPAIGAAAGAAALILILGGFVFYNTNVLNEYRTSAERSERRAEYERRYGHFEGIPQPRLTGTSLHVEIHPERRAVEIRGSYVLENRSQVAVDSLHLATVSRVETGDVAFDRPATIALSDDELGHRIYVLETPLQPGDSLMLEFRVQHEPRGFPNSRADASVARNGTYFAHRGWLPAIGYQRSREIANAGERRARGLPSRPAVRSLEDMGARQDPAGDERISFEAVVGTDEGQIALAPGRLRRTWTEDGRRYFHYEADVPIRNDYAFFSAAYAVHEARWNDVRIQIFHHPGHARNLERMTRSVQASLTWLTEHLGPYPHGQIRLVEHPGRGIDLHAYPVNISYQEGFSHFNPEDDPRDLDFPFAVVAHEVAHQWWGNQVTGAPVEGSPLLSESLAWYSAMAVVEETHGHEHLRQLLSTMRMAYLSPRARAGVPLLRAYDRFHAYRKGPFAMYALREYVGRERVNEALRRLIEDHGSGVPPLPTSLDLYRELRAVTPDSLRYLLVDLFEANTYWELTAEEAAAVQEESGSWQVTLDVKARKVVVDSADVETEIPMDDLVEVGVYAAPEDGRLGEPLYLRMHRVRSGAQRITVTVPGEPARAGIDPRNLLIDVEPDDNRAEVTREGGTPAGSR